MQSSADWSWPENLQPDTTPQSEPTSASASGNDQSRQPKAEPDTESAAPPPPPPDPRKYMRKCRICLEEVEPTIDDEGKRHYPEEEGGPMLCPCMCKGSVKWVHEACLKEWMNFKKQGGYKCDLCQYEYRIERMNWATRLQSPLLSVLITILILISSVFLLGFIADPILSLWLDPVGTVTDTVVSRSSMRYEDPDPYEDEEGWFVHFLKGLFSLGLLGFVKTFLVMSPWQWWNLRSSGVLNSGAVRRGGTGRDRMENINLTLVLIGVVTFLWTTWKVTRKYTERTLERASQKILNVQHDDDDED
ncbi:hypothetical protein F5Y15DRAFT_368992 [Xylariaceae sp. FL0016]|nr:hypothetical protein F5Y15DRAFT_368992 [Xylariaceae sp. FL0016]